MLILNCLVAGTTSISIGTLSLCSELPKRPLRLEQRPCPAGIPGQHEHGRVQIARAKITATADAPMQMKTGTRDVINIQAIKMPKEASRPPIVKIILHHFGSTL